MESSKAARDFIRKEVPDWDDEVISTARFKAFSGQRSDWEPKYVFWRDLILKVARHLRLFIIHPSQLKNDWFDRGGLSPLCLDHVLFLMYNEGDIVRSVDLLDPTSGRLSQLFKRVRNLIVGSTATPEVILEGHVILTALLKDKADEVVDLLSEGHWTSTCVVTMKKFQNLCGGESEASAVLTCLCGRGKALYLSVGKKEFVEGIKVSLSPAPVSTISSLDRDVLHLIWTTEKLQQQIDMIDRRHEMSRKSALVALNSGNKKVALRHARELKLASESREKCYSLLSRVEEVLNVIANAESTKKVSEAIQIGAQAIKQNKITVEEVELCLEELEESIDLQKQVEQTLESTPSYISIEDEDIAEELKKLELKVESANHPPKVGTSNTSGETVSLESPDVLTEALSNLKIHDTSSRKSANQDTAVPMRIYNTKNVVLEPA